MPTFRRGPLRPQEFFRPLQPIPAPQLIVPAQGVLTLTSFAPTVSTPVVITPGVGALVLAGKVPTAATPRLVTPATRSLVLTGLAPSVSTPRVITPDVRVLVLTGFSPSASVPLSVVITPATAHLVLAGLTPDVQGDLHSGAIGHVVSDTGRRLRFPLTPEFRPVLVQPPTAHLTLRGFASGVIVAESAVDITEAYIALYASGALSDEEFVALLAA